MNPFYDCPLCRYDKFTKNWVYENIYKHILEDGTELVITASADKDGLLKGNPFSMQIKLIAPGKDYVIRRIHFILDDRLFHFTDGSYSDGFGLLQMNRVTKEFYNRLVDAQYIALQVECTAFTKLPAETEDNEVNDADRSERRRNGFLDKVLNGGYDFDRDVEKNASESAMFNRYGDEKFTIDPIPAEEIIGIIQMAKMIRECGVWEMESDYDAEPKDDYSEPLR